MVMMQIQFTNIATFFFLFVIQGAYTQKKFDLKVNITEFDLEDMHLYGFETNFGFSRKEIRKGWWEFTKQYGKLTNMRSYYRLKISGRATGENTGLTIYFRSTEAPGGSRLEIGTEEKKYRNDLKDLLIAFKKDFYLRYYLDQLRRATASGERAGKAYPNILMPEEKNEWLEQLQMNQEKLHQLRTAIKAILTTK